MPKNIKPDILPKSGAGQDGTDTLVNSYKKDTPGYEQQVKKKLNKGTTRETTQP